MQGKDFERKYGDIIKEASERIFGHLTEGVTEDRKAFFTFTHHGHDYLMVIKEINESEVKNND